MDKRQRNDQSREAEPVVISDGPAGVGGPVESFSQNSTGNDERIARRAYERYEERGGEHGRDVDDWLEAERELINLQDKE